MQIRVCMHVPMCALACMNAVCMHVWTDVVCTMNAHTCMYACTYVCTCMHECGMHACMDRCGMHDECTYVYVCMYALACTCLWRYLCIYNVRVCLCMYVERYLPVRFPSDLVTRRYSSMKWFLTSFLIILEASFD
jgi:hypothetical protein